MTDLVYRSVMRDLKENILNNRYPKMKLPDERSLSQHYQVSRSTIKRALDILVQQGIIFKKRGSGTFINPLYLKNRAMFRYEGSNLGITDSFRLDGKKQSIKLLNYRVIPASKEIQQDLFLNENDYVYKIERLRLIDEQPFMIETGYIPIKILPSLTPAILEKSIFNYLEDVKDKRVTRSYLTLTVEPSQTSDQKLLKLKPTEPLGVMNGVFFLDDGTPFEVSNMRVHYKYMRFNTFVSVGRN